LAHIICTVLFSNRAVQVPHTTTCGCLILKMLL